MRSDLLGIFAIFCVAAIACAAYFIYAHHQKKEEQSFISLGYDWLFSLAECGDVRSFEIFLSHADLGKMNHINMTDVKIAEMARKESEGTLSEAETQQYLKNPYALHKNMMSKDESYATELPIIKKCPVNTIQAKRNAEGKYSSIFYCKDYISANFFEKDLKFFLGAYYKMLRSHGTAKETITKMEADISKVCSVKN